MAGACPIDPAAAIVQTDEPRPGGNTIRARTRALPGNPSRFARTGARFVLGFVMVMTMRARRCYSLLLAGGINETVARDRWRDCLMRRVETGRDTHRCQPVSRCFEGVCFIGKPLFFLGFFNWPQASCHLTPLVVRQEGRKSPHKAPPAPKPRIPPNT